MISNGLWSSCQGRTSASILRVSWTEGTSKKGVTTIGLAVSRDQGSGGALGAPPADAGEVFEGGAGFDEDCRELPFLQK